MSDVFKILNLNQPTRKEGSPLYTFDLLNYAPTLVKGCRIVTNSRNGSLFVAWPQRPYTAQDGQKKYVSTVDIHNTIGQMVLREIMSRSEGGQSCQGNGGRPPQQQQGQYPPRQSHPQGYDDDYTAYQGEADEIPF